MSGPVDPISVHPRTPGLALMRSWHWEDAPMQAINMGTVLPITQTHSTTHPVTGERRCFGCKAWLPRDDFVRSQGNPHGRERECLQCNRARHRRARVTS